MKKQVFKRLQPFLKRKSARQKLILYLIADGYTVGDLTRMTVEDLRGLDLKHDMDVARDEALEGRRSGPAFIYPNGNQIPHTAYYRLLRRAGTGAIGRPVSQEQLREYVRE